MRTIKTVGIKALKDKLSQYLRDVKGGVLVLITDRGSVIAELHEPTIDLKPKENSSIKAEWIREGKLIPPKTKKNICSISTVKVKAGTSKILLDQERGE